MGGQRCVQGLMWKWNSNLKRTLLCNTTALKYICKRMIKIKFKIRMISSFFWVLRSSHEPSSIYSCSIGHIWEHELCHLGCWAVKEKFLKRRNFCLSKQLFEVVFSCFEGQKFNFLTFKTWKNHHKKLLT